MSRNEAQTRLELVDPCLVDQREWPRANIRVEVTAAAVDIINGKGHRRPSGRADYVLFAPLQDGAIRASLTPGSKNLNGLNALRQDGQPADLLRKTKEMLFAALFTCLELHRIGVGTSRPHHQPSYNPGCDGECCMGGDVSSPSSRLPQIWRRVSIDEVCIRETGTRDPRREPQSPCRYVDISSVDNRRKIISEARTVLGKDAPSRARQVIRTHDVLVATTRPNRNAVALVPPELDTAICSTGFCVLRTNGQMDPACLFFLVQSRGVVSRLSDLVKGALCQVITDRQVKGRLSALLHDAVSGRLL